jgi:hypothetical protein
METWLHHQCQVRVEVHDCLGQEELNESSKDDGRGRLRRRSGCGGSGVVQRRAAWYNSDTRAPARPHSRTPPTYYAWFEFYPKGSYLIGSYNRKTGLCQSNCVSVGDLITADVSYGTGGPKGNRGSSFTVTITDGTAGWSFSTSSSVASAQQASAEWIAEAPSSGGVLPLADFGSVTFSGGQATIGNTTGNIGSFSNPDAINMVNSAGVVIAQTSVLDKKAGFTVTFVP